MSSLTLTRSNLFNVDMETELNRFISDTVQPDQQYLRIATIAIDKVVTFLQHNAPASLRPCSVIKGGSFSKGTAVKGKSDLDIVVMMNNYTSVRGLVKDMGSILENLTRCMQGCPGISVTECTHRCVKVKIIAGGSHIEVDILPALDVLNGRTLDALYDEMGNQASSKQGYYSPCLVALQKRLFDGIPTEVKSLIRLLKYWQKNKLQAADPNTKWPASYALELIAIHCWTTAGEPQRFNMVRALYAVLNSLDHHEGFRVTFPERMFYSRRFLDFNDIKKPYIMDPCNPYNNVYYKGSYDWGETAKRAREWLQKPLFATCSGSSKTQWI